MFVEDTKEEIEQPPKQNTVTLNIVKDNNFGKVFLIFVHLYVFGLSMTLIFT